MAKKKEIALCVDLDGTLLKSDILYESVLLMIKKRPYLIFLLPFWILRGKVYLKKRMYDIIKINPKHLPYNTEIIEFIKQEREKGREVALATATWKPVAEAIAEYLGLFDRVIATGANLNLRGKNKLIELEKIYGEGNFDYVGDSSVDLPILEKSRYAYLVNPKKDVESKAKNKGNVQKIFNDRKPLWKLFLKQIRVYQWVKNILLFLPLIMAHELVADKILLNIYAFFAFSLAASSVYVLNDMMDLESDRVHPRKRNRPMASGYLSVKSGMMIFPVFLISSIAISVALLPLEFTLILLTYLVLTSTYSFYLKKIYIFDIIVLASLYTIRLYAGALAVDVTISTWLIAFSMFVFLSLGIVKRFTELYSMEKNQKRKTSGRGYMTDDMGMLRSAGISTALISVLVYALYVNDLRNTAAVNLYKRPELLYFVAPFLLYWLMRIWLKAGRGEMHDDPIVFTGRDPVGYFILIIIGLVVIGATI